MSNQSNIIKLKDKLTQTTGIEQVDCLLELAMFYMHKDPQLSFQYSEQAITLANIISYDEGLNQATYFKGLSMINSGEYKAALTFLLDAVENVMKSPGDLLRGKVYNGIGNGFNKLGFISTALPYYLKALDIFEQLGYADGISACITNIGIIHFYDKNYEKSLQYHLKAKQIQEKTGDKVKVGNIDNNIGYLYTQLGELEKALDYFNEAMKIESNRVRGLVHNNLAYLYIKIGKPDLALEHGYKGLKIRQELKDQHGILTSYSNIATVYFHIQDYEKALNYRLKSLHLGEKISASFYLNKNYRYLSEIYYKKRDIDNVFYYQQKYIESNEKLYGEEKSKALTEMEIKYETQKKVKETEIYRLKNVELKRTLDQLKKTQAQLIQQEKMASVGVLTAGIAHEINNPVNFISANIAPLQRNIRFFLELINMYENKATPEEIADFKEEIDFDYTKEETFGMINDISEGVTRTKEIIKGLSNFSRNDRNVRQVVNIQQCLESTLSLLKTQIGKDIIISRKFTNIPTIVGLHGKINQVFMNILTNAIQAAENNLGKKEVIISTWADTNFVYISITDNGIGMTEETKSKIYDPFFTTKEVGKGTGLGLSICFNIIEEHHGTIDVESEYGSGATFTISLPINFTEETAIEE